jgi:hypothetical protein
VDQRERDKLRAREYRARKRQESPCGDCGRLGKVYHSRFCEDCSRARADAARQRAREWRKRRYRERMETKGEEERAKRRHLQKAWYHKNPESARVKGRERMRRLRERRYSRGLDARGQPRPFGFQTTKSGKTRGIYVEHGRKSPIRTLGELIAQIRRDQAMHPQGGEEG